MKLQLKICLLLLWATLSAVFAQEDGLWPEAVDALVLEEQHKFEIIDIDKARYKVRRVVIFFNDKEADHHARVEVSESSLIESRGISARITDLSGKLLKKIGKDDIQEAQVSAGYQFYSDSKHQWADLSWAEYPYRIEYEFELEYKTLFLWPGWMPREDIPVLKAGYQLILPSESFEYYVHQQGFDTAPVKNLAKDGRVEVRWDLEHIAPLPENEYTAPEDRDAWQLRFAPGTFRLGDYTGRSDSWDNFAAWYRSLLSDRGELPEAAKMRVQEAVAGVEDTREKIERLYRMLQEDTRYVAIALDIGGWQPHDLPSIYHNRYGDCKDLTILMISMLREAGITAYPALMRTRNEGAVITDFPVNQFNHVLACVPTATDTLWLECTADYTRSGDLHYTREDCHVLLVGDQGGEIVYIPPSPAEENRMTSILRGNVTSQGLLKLQGTVEVTGNQADYTRSKLIYSKADARRDWLCGSFLGRHMPKLELAEYNTRNVEGNYDRPLVLEFNGEATHYAAGSASRIFLNPNILNRTSPERVPEAGERTIPVYFNYAYLDQDSLVLELPFGYTLEAGPKPLELATDFGFYKTDYRFEGRTLYYSRTYRLNQKSIPPEQYEDFRQFIAAVSKNDQGKFVFRK